jgi:hypothetical protein
MAPWLTAVRFGPSLHHIMRVKGVKPLTSHDTFRSGAYAHSRKATAGGYDEERERLERVAVPPHEAHHTLST